MGRAPCCDKANVKRGPWSPEEDATLKDYLHKYGTGGNWISLPHRAGLKRCGKSCRLRWLNYLRPDIKHGAFTEEEDNIIISLYSKMGSRWSVIAANLPERTDNDVKNHWNTKLKKKLFGGGNNKFNHSTTPNLANIAFTNNNLTNNNPLIQAPTSSSTPTPSLSPSPSYVKNNHNYYEYQDQNHLHKHHQFHVPIPSFSSLLSQCTNNIPISLVPNFNTLTNVDHPYVHDPLTNPTLTRYPFHQAQVMSNSSSALGNNIGSVLTNDEVSSFSDSSTGVYGSSLEDDPFLAELGFGLMQDMLMTPTRNYGDQDDIKPQGLDQSVTNY